MDNLEILRRLTEIYGPSTMEEGVIAEIKNILGDKYEYSVTPHKNLVVYPRGNSFKRTIVFQAHMDELGFRPYRYRPDGFIELSAMAGIPRAATNSRLRFEPGGTHGILLISSEGGKNRFFLDAGAKDEKEALDMVPYHASGAYTDIEFATSESLLLCKSFDDRAGCAIITEFLKEWDGSGDTRIVGLFTAREETGDWPIPEVYRLMNEKGLMPEFILNLEVCPGGPSPLESEPLAIVGKGVVLIHMDKSYSADPDICRGMRDLAVESNVPYQIIAMREGAGEMGRYALGFGVKGYSLTIPGRYAHSPNSVISKTDYMAARELVRAVGLNYPFS